MIASPCIKLCTLDAEGVFCLGCLRTVDEIAAWGSMGDEARARVLAELPARGREAIRCSSCGAVFGCGANDPNHTCWCATLPPVAPSVARGGCLCPACLAALSDSKTA
jgi:predicted Fe-S protein YdhL (DUF1289 family)